MLAFLHCIFNGVLAVLRESFRVALVYKSALLTPFENLARCMGSAYGMIRNFLSCYYCISNTVEFLRERFLVAFP